ncbi:MAG: CynX/NimT family MFS transporter [Vicinamibacterales bacterium]
MRLANTSDPISNHVPAPSRAIANWAGWLNVVVAAVIMLATLPGRTQGLGLITEPMLRDLQLDRVTYASINLWATLLGAAICLPIGRMFDRIGLRNATVALTMLLGIVVWTMSALAGGALALFALVLATRALGQSALSVASITAVAKSFNRRVGLAMAVYSVLLTMFFAAAFTAVGTSVRVDGWRVGWRQVAIALFVCAPIVLLLRERAMASQDDDPTDTSDSFSLADALRTPAFWVFGGATSLFGLVSSGLGLFNEAVLAERGFDQQTYVRFLAGTSIVGLVGQLVCGWLTLHWPMQRLLAIAMFIYAGALASLPLLTNATELWLFAVLIGLSGGMITVIFFAVWRRAFGPVHLGRIQGAAQMLTVLASAIGPLIFAQSASWTGSYFPALWTLAPCVLAFSIAASRVRLPEHQMAVRG